MFHIHRLMTLLLPVLYWSTLTDITPNSERLKTSAMKCFRYLEHRSSQDHSIRQKYLDFMKDYLGSNYMELAPYQEKELPYSYQSESLSTKLRVVFDFLSRTTTRQSLNDI